MTKYKTFGFILPVVFGITALLAVPRPQEQTSLPKSSPTKSRRKVDVNRFPVVEFSSPKTKDAKRRTRAEKRDKSHWRVDPDAVSDSTVTVDSIDFNLPAFPTKQSMDRLPGTNGAAWAHGATVTVIINPTDFPSSTERAKIEAAFLAWQNANTNSGVTFTFTTGSEQPSGAAATNTYYINRAQTTTPASSSISNTGSPTTEGNITTALRKERHLCLKIDSFRSSGAKNLFQVPVL